MEMALGQGAFHQPPRPREETKQPSKSNLNVDMVEVSLRHAALRPLQAAGSMGTLALLFVFLYVACECAAAGFIVVVTSLPRG
jgi:hypothetical protein